MAMKKNQRTLRGLKNTSSAPTNLEAILTERGENYGNFLSQASVSQELQYVVNQRLKNNPEILRADQREALQIILHKISRIVNGNPHFADSWRDIAGYATLVADRLEATNA